MSPDDPARIRYGTDELRPAATLLRAGALTADLVDGALRAVRWDGAEVLRGIAYVVRDRDWGTDAPNIEDLIVEGGPDGFHVGFAATYKRGEGPGLRCAAAITGTAEGRLDFEVTARAEADFETNRCGFCVLHPVVGVAGRPVSVEHVDGGVTRSVMPDLVEPWQPFKEVRAITHRVSGGVRATCRLLGDTFEMEDQRAWSDASFKTYVRPLALPWPYVIPAGVDMRQSVSLKIAAPRRATRVSRKLISLPRIDVGREIGAMPAFGVVITPEEAENTVRQAQRFGELAPQSMLLHFDPTSGHAEAAAALLADAASVWPAERVVELVLPGVGTPEEELAEAAATLRAGGLEADALVVSPAADRTSTPPGSRWPDCPPLEEVYGAARRAFPGVRLGGGAISYFTELNRKRPPVELLDFVSHCTCPIVHAADDLGVMQSLETLPFIARTVRAFAGQMPYRIGPSTIGMRQNPYGSKTFGNPDRRRVPMTHADPRQQGLFAAAWMVGYAAATAGADLSCLTAAALTGSFGVIPTDAHGRDTDRVNPAFHAARALSSLAGLPRLDCTSSEPGSCVGFAARHERGTDLLWVANLTDDERTIEVPIGFESSITFDEYEWEALSRGLLPVRRRIAGQRVTLPPYAFATLEAG